MIATINPERLRKLNYVSVRSGTIRGFGWKLISKTKFPNGLFGYTFQMTDWDGITLTSTPRFMLSSREETEKVADRFIHEMNCGKELKAE